MCSLLLPYTDSKLKFVTKIQLYWPQIPELAENHWRQVSCPRPKRKKKQYLWTWALQSFRYLHLSMVCPRMGGLGNPGELDFVKCTCVGILTSTTFPGVGHLTWLPSWNIPKIHESEFSVSKSTVHCKEYCVAFFKNFFYAHQCSVFKVL